MQLKRQNDALFDWTKLNLGCCCSWEVKTDKIVQLYAIYIFVNVYSVEVHKNLRSF